MPDALQSVLDNLLDGVITIDVAGTIRTVNLAVERIFGYPAAELIGQNVKVLMPEPYRSEHDGYLANYQRTGHAKIIGIGREAVGRRKDGSTFPLDLAVSAFTADGERRFTGIVRDITERKAAKELEARFLRAQRLESIGTLVSGIAHDLNNVLTPVLMAVKLLKRDKPGLDKPALLDVVQASAERGATILKQLLAFAGGLPGARVPMHVKHVVREVAEILGHTLPKSVTIRTHLPDGLWPVNGDVTQLTQVLMNLCVNARDAMPQGGTVTIGVENKRLSDAIARLYPHGKPGPHVVLSVADTGVGIPPDVQQKMFDPFFTTKPFGQGTGLGLSTVVGIVTSHAGFVNVYSEVGRGTKVTVFLPAVAALADPMPAVAEESPTPGAGQLVLVIDDESAILAATKATLEAFGYAVVTANGGRAGMDAYRQHGDAVAMVLLDMMMAEVDGPAVLAELRRMNPAVRVVTMSGLRSTIAGVAFLPKPFSDDDLLRAIADRIQGG